MSMANAPEPRSNRSRLVMTLGLWVVLMIGPILLADAVLGPAGSPDQDARLALNWTQAVASAITLPIFAVLAPRVSYRWFDAFWLLVPVYSLVWAFKILWRVTFLPLRDYRPRDDEADRWTQVTDTPRPLYVKVD